MELVREINYKKRNWTRDFGIIMLGMGLMLVCIDFYWAEFMAAKWYHLLIAFVITFPLHELAHGLLFRRWTGKVKFGAGLTRLGPVFFATSPGTTLPRNKMIAVALAPQALTVPCLLAAGLLDLSIVSITLTLIGIFNLGGGVGDFYCIFQMLKYPKELQVEDVSMGLKFYLPAEGGTSESSESTT